jgi:hypothetical protein
VHGVNVVVALLYGEYEISCAMMCFHAILVIDVVQVQVMPNANVNISLVHAVQSKKQDPELPKSWINLANILMVTYPSLPMVDRHSNVLLLLVANTQTLQDWRSRGLARR